MLLHFIAQPRLISSIRTTKRRTIFDHSNLSFWRETPLAVNPLVKDPQLISRRLEQLACRTLLQIVMPEDQAWHVQSSSISNYQSIKEDAMTSCARLISQLYDQADHHDFVGSLVDAYDIFSAGVVHLCLSSRAGDQIGQQLLLATKVTNKCLTLLTIIGERFPYIKGFRRALDAMLNAALEGYSTHSKVSHLLRIQTMESKRLIRNRSFSRICYKVFLHPCLVG